MGGEVSLSCKSENWSYAVDQYGSSRGQGIFLVASCLRNHDKLCPDGPVDVYANLDPVCIRVRSHFYPEKNLHGSAFGLLGTRGTMQVFERQSVQV